MITGTPITTSAYLGNPGQTVVIYLPLAPIVEAIRGVTIEAKPIWDFSFELAVLAFWIAGTSLLAIRTFRFH